MKMPRSRCENDNVQFVQELAEVDGPFESPININFRDLPKLELPSLVWNHCEIAPKKMKITNTGHTVIISGKWKCERPFLTGGPLSGKYVFSQIHFHWGQDDCKGSEHQVCGEGFPLEMHVAHFKADYATQENALREKDGMVVVVYLFKLQDEPNAALKKILSCLPYVKQASTSQVMDPRPILSLCNPFMDDYFMYWGSVVTPTCAHILLWIVCREPFGISRDQVNEFRKLCDATQQPICRNNRDPQPLHRRNVFHVNASKNLDDPLLPIKKMMGCYCKGSEENLRMKSQGNGSGCQAHMRNQEDIEGNTAENKTGCGGRNYAGSRGMVGKVGLPQSFYVRQTFTVQRAAVKSVPQLSKWWGNDIIPQCGIKTQNRTKSEVYSNLKNISHSCCFLPYKEAHKMKIIDGKRKIRGKKQPLASLKALSHIMDSLEALKNHTVKKLKEIESINQEIKGMKPFCQDSEDKRWLRKVEKMMSRQKRVTMKASKSCLGELKKLARECNFDKFYDNKPLPVENTETVQEKWTNNEEVVEKALPCSEACPEKSFKENVSVVKTPSNPSLIEKEVKLSVKAQQLIQSFFEDIKESEELQQTVEKDLQLKKISSCGLRQEQAGDSTPVTNPTKGLITQKMFNLGNLGDRFFAEVTSEELPPEGNDSGDKVASNGLVVFEDEIESKKSAADGEESDKDANANLEEVKVYSEPSNHADGAIPLHRTNVTISLSKPTEKTEEMKESLLLYNNEKEPELGILDGLSDTESTSCSESFYPYKKPNKDYLNKSIDAYFRKQLNAVANYKLTKHLKVDDFLLDVEKSSSNLSTESTDTQRMIIAKFHKRQSRKDIWQKKSSTVRKVSSKALYGRTSWRKFRNKLRNINVEGYYIRKKNQKKHKRKKGVKTEGAIKRTPSSYERSSTSKDDLKTLMKKSKWKGLAKTKFKLEIKKTSDSTLDSELEYSFLSPERKKLKLECKRVKGNTHKSKNLSEGTQMYFADDDTRTLNIPKKSVNKFKNQENVDLYLLRGNENDGDDDDGDDRHGVANVKKSNAHSPELNPRILTRIHIPRSSANETRANSRESTKKTARVSSADSKSSCLETPEINKLNTNDSPRMFNTENKRRSPSLCSIGVKNRSLTSLTPRSKDRPCEISQRVFVESIDLRMNGREVYEPKRNPDSPRQEICTRTLTPRTVSRRTSNENNKKSEREGNQEIPKQEFNVEFFTSTFESESSKKGQKEHKKCKNPPLKRCDNEKYYFLEKVLDEKGAEGQDDIIIEERPRPESVQSDTNRPPKPGGPSMKGDAVVSTADNRELHSSVSYSTQKKNPQSRSYSAESLSSMKKVCRWKGKKRPHCCKRNSRHYIRKNSSFYKKLNKTDNRTINFFGLTEEEQLKIISVNVAKYLEQKLVECKTKFDSKNECFSKETEIVLKNCKAPEEKSSPPRVVETKQEEIPIAKPVEKVVKRERIAEVEHSKADGIKEIKLEDSVKEKKLPPSPRPVHNFIKLNKLMAGKYKRSPTTPVEKIADDKNKTNESLRQENLKPKPKIVRKKKEKLYLSKRLEQIKDDKKPTPIQKVTNKTNNGKTNRGKTSAVIKKKGSEQLKTQDKPGSPSAGKKVQKNQEAKTDARYKEPPPAPLVLQKISQAKNRRIPAYMVTSYLPAPMEIVEKQQQKMNRYLLNMNPPKIKEYLSEVLNEPQMKNRNKKNGDTLLSKELEYLIRSMCLNNEISTNMENSMNYVKTLLGQDYNGPSFIDKSFVSESLLDFYEPRKKGVVLTEMNTSLDCSSSNSDYTEDSDKYSLSKSPADGKQNSKSKTKSLVSSTTANESGDSKMIDSTLLNGYEAPEGLNSDSGYNCEISITLNAGSVEGESDINPIASKNSISELGAEPGYNMEQNQTVQSCSQVSLKPHRKKRKENEISVEMKQKLLEILEEEIKREMEASYFVASENSSETMTWKWEDTDVINRSQSTDSSSDNIEVLSQISETMRQYLTEFIERRLAARKDKSLDEERKDEDMS